MTDIEIVKRCAERMGFKLEPIGERFRVRDADGDIIYGIGDGWIIARWNPLHDKAQAMDMVEKFRLRLTWLLLSSGVVVEVQISDLDNPLPWSSARNADLLRAICECVAKI